MLKDQDPSYFQSDYFKSRLVGNQRWMSYFRQLSEVLAVKPDSVLEVGIGNMVVTDYLRRRVPFYASIDIDPHAATDVRASVLAFPFENDSFDVALCAEVLEHLPYAQFQVALRELYRVAKRYIVLSIPQSGVSVGYVLRLPLIGEIAHHKKIALHRKHTFNGLHHWEINWKGYSLAKIRADIIDTGLQIKREIHPFESPYNHFFVLECKDT